MVSPRVEKKIGPEIQSSRIWHRSTQSSVVQVADQCRTSFGGFHRNVLQFPCQPNASWFHHWWFQVSTFLSDPIGLNHQSGSANHKEMYDELEEFGSQRYDIVMGSLVCCHDWCFET